MDYINLLGQDGSKKFVNMILESSFYYALLEKDIKGVIGSINEKCDPYMVIAKGARDIYYSEDNYLYVNTSLKSIYGKLFESTEDFDAAFIFAISKLLYAFYTKSELMYAYYQASDDDELYTLNIDGKKAVKSFDEIDTSLNKDDMRLIECLNELRESEIGTR